MTSLGSPVDSSNGDLTAERLSLGVAARLARYLQVLTQAKKEGKETISSQELSDYTHVNSTQIRRDLSGFGKFGKRGVGYNVDSLVSQIRKILRTAGQHNIALVGAGNLGSAIAASTILPKRGFVIHDVFDDNPEKIGRTVGNVVVKHIDELKKSVTEAEEIIGIIATPASSAQEVAELMVDSEIRVILNYTDVLLHVPSQVDVHRIDPTAQLMHTLYYLTQAEGQEAS